jgi:hypothetical protein
MNLIAPPAFAPVIAAHDVAQLALAAILVTGHPADSKNDFR